MFTVVAVPFEAFQALPPFDFKLMAALLRYVNRLGECDPALRQLAGDVLASEATVSRAMARLEERGCFTRERQGTGRYLYRVAERFLPRRPKPRLRPKSHLAPVQVRLSHGARQEVASSGSKEPSEREQLSQQDEIPVGWEEAAAAERRLAGLGEVNLRAEWRKLVAYSEGQRITIWRWRGWVLKARGAAPVAGARPESVVVAAACGGLPGDERQQRQARDWVRQGFWLRSGTWGPAPDQAGCQLPAELVAWCLRERAAAKPAAA